MNISSLTTTNGQEIELGKFSVLVGPNNVGKSQTLKDIHAIMMSGGEPRTVLISEVEIPKPENFDDIFDGLTIRPHANRDDLRNVRGIGSNLHTGGNIDIAIDKLEREFNASSDLGFTFGNIGQFRVSYLDADSRLQVAKRTKSFDAQNQPPQSLLQALYVHEEVEEALREVFQSVFQMDIQLDYSGLQNLVFRVSHEFDEIPPDPRAARPILEKYPVLDDQGDGFKSFAGVVLSLLLSRHRIVLLDEPEAFLHPAQARQLGNWIARHARTIPGQIVVATHNSNFLAGILSAEQDVDIYRLDRTGDTTTFKPIPADVTRNLATSPVLSSQRILEAIFHKGVVVCEGDSDRAVYQSIASVDLGREEFLFVHAHNKQTIPAVVDLLSSAGIPTRAIADIDILNASESLTDIVASQGGKADVDELKALCARISSAVDTDDEGAMLAQLQEEIAEFLGQLQDGAHDLNGARGALNRLRRSASNWSEIKRGGIDGAPDEVRDDVRRAIDLAASHGLYIVPVGILENWMDLGVRRKNVWIVRALEAIQDEDSSEDLREFVQQILDSF